MMDKNWHWAVYFIAMGATIGLLVGAEVFLITHGAPFPRIVFNTLMLAINLGCVTTMLRQYLRLRAFWRERRALRDAWERWQRRP